MTHAVSLVHAKALWASVSRACTRARQGLGASHVTRTTLLVTAHGQLALGPLLGAWPRPLEELFRSEHVHEAEVRLLIAALLEHVLNDRRARHVTDVIAGFHRANSTARDLLAHMAVTWDPRSTIGQHSLLTAALAWAAEVRDTCQLPDWLEQLALTAFRAVHTARLPFMERVRYVECVGAAARDSTVVPGLLLDQGPSVTLLAPDTLDGARDARVIVVSAALTHRTKTRVKEGVALDDVSRGPQFIAWLSSVGPRVILCTQWDIPNDILSLMRLYNYTERVNQRPRWLVAWNYVAGDLLEDIALYSNCHIVTHIDTDHALDLPFIGTIDHVREYRVTPDRSLYWLARDTSLPNVSTVLIRGPSAALRQHVKQQLVSHLSRLEQVLTARDPLTPVALVETPEPHLNELLQRHCYESRDAHVVAHATEMRAWGQAVLNLVPATAQLRHVTVDEKIDVYTRATELACQLLKIDQGILYSE